MKINCNNTLNYLKEKARFLKDTKLDNATKEIHKLQLENMEEKRPEIALETVQNWSDNNPIPTYLSDFLNKFPNAKLDANGIPTNVYPCSLGYTCDNETNCKGNCEECWKKPLANDLGHVNTAPTTVLNMADRTHEKEEKINNFLADNGYPCKVKITESEDYQLPLPYVFVKLVGYSIYLVSKADKMTIDDISIDIILERLSKFITKKTSSTSQFLR